MHQFIENYNQWLLQFGLSESLSKIVSTISILLIIALVSYLSDVITKRIIIRFIEKIVTRTKSTWDDIFLEKKVFNRLAHIVPAMVIHYGIDLVFQELPGFVNFAQTLIYIYMTLVITLVATTSVNALHAIYQTLPMAKNRHIKGYVQLVIILVWVICGIVVYGHITGNPVKEIIAGLGAMAAILLLVFKDTIMGLVASVQLTANNMVKIGDWIAMPSHKADGTVEEITLNTVKVQNWDKTISTIPTYALVSESFTNWRGMEESGGRRIKRSINMDMRSVKFCSEEMFEKFNKIGILSDRIHKTREEIEAYNKSQQFDDSNKVNGRRMTNLGVFRSYMEQYLKLHPKINQEMTFLVRQMQPSEKGIPMEIYVFSKDQEWANYESIQADIFDHILAVIPEFELRVFQEPTGYDMEQIKVGSL